MNTVKAHSVKADARSEIAEAVRLLGPTFSPTQIAATRELYVPRALRPEDAEARVTRDVQYGEDPRQRLDIFAPELASASRPVLVFVHGGGFVQGDKGNAGEPFYNNVGAWAVRSGFIGVTMTYRLAPAHVWPSGAQDASLALQWLRSHVQEHGGDPERLVLMGHSAGAAHVAGCLAGHGAVPGKAAAAILVSGIFSLRVYKGSYDYQSYYGADRSRDEERSTVAALAGLKIPSVFAITEFDPPQFHEHLSDVFAARVAASGQSPEVLWQRDHNHVSVVMQIGSDVDSLGPALAEFIRQRVG